MHRFLRTFFYHLVPTEGNAYRPRLLTRPWLLFFLTIVLTIEGVFFASTQVVVPLYERLAAVAAGDIVALTNSQRLQNGVGILTENVLLDQAAQAKAEDMAGKGYFAHVSPDGTEPWAWITGAEYRYEHAGENLAVRFEDSAEVVSAWMASPSHRANIVKPEYTEIGVGVAQGVYKGSPAIFVAQYFASPSVDLGEGRASPSNTLAVAPTAPASPSREVSSPAPAVAGAETVAAPSVAPGEGWAASAGVPDVTQSTIRQFLQSIADNPRSIAWALGVIALFVGALVLLGFAVHVQIQPTEMLAGGAVVALLAGLFIVLNAQVVASPGAGQQAAVGASPPGLIDPGAATIVRTTRVLD